MPLGDGVEEGTVELVGAVGRAHHAAGEFEHWCCAFGAQHEHLKAVVDDSWVARAATSPLVELQHRIVATWIEEGGNAALPLQQFPFNRPDALHRHSGENHSVACADGYLAC